MKLFAIFLLFLFFGCDENPQNMKYPYDGSVSVGSGWINYRIVVIDSCEYVVVYNSMAHKGNCKHCIERNK